MRWVVPEEGVEPSRRASGGASVSPDYGVDGGPTRPRAIKRLPAVLASCHVFLPEWCSDP
jgi:hypothetical protein